MSIKKIGRMLGYSPKNTYLCSVKRRNQVEPRCAERWHGCGNTEMMSDSNSPLGFFHSNKKLAMCDQLLLFLDVSFFRWMAGTSPLSTLVPGCPFLNVLIVRNENTYIQKKQKRFGCITIFSYICNQNQLQWTRKINFKRRVNYGIFKVQRLHR